MAVSKNTFSVKSTMYPTPHSNGRSVDGPWRPTVAEAVTAYVEMLVKQDLDKHLVCRPFIAERTDEKTAPAKDGRGVCYKTNDDATKALPTTLAQKGCQL
jgi:hypothetical protein